MDKEKMMNGGKMAKDLIMNKVGNFFKITENGCENGNRNAIDFSTHKYYFTDILPNGDYECTVEFLQKIMESIYKHIDKTNQRDEKILDFHFPNDLKKELDLDIKPESLPLDKIIDDCKTAIRYAVKTGHPRFFNQISQGLDIVSLAGEWVTAATNTNMFTYEIAPFYNLVEEVVLAKMRDCIGWGGNGDGLFNPGGSISNLYAVLVARHHRFPESKIQGLYGLPKMTVFTSEHSHYSVHRAVAMLGFGLDQIRQVPVDKAGRLIPEKFEMMVKESKAANEVPFLVILTAGTTVLGAFDPIEPVYEICKAHNMWLHIDAAWGGGALLSRDHRHLLKGIEKADSVTWNPHKLMGCLLQSSAFLVKEKGILLSCNEMNATYLFQQDKHYDVCYDTGDKTIQCGRHVDVFKLWLMWRAKGDDGFERQINKLFDLAKLLYEQLKLRPNFEIALEDPVFTNICFWYVPNSLKGLDKSTFEYKEKLNNIAPKIKERMMLKGSIMIGYQPLDDKPNFFRVIISNAASKEEDIYFMLDEIERLGYDL